MELIAYYNVGLAKIVTAFLWYYGNATDTYHYYGVVDLGGGAPPGNVVRGDVLGGVVIPLDTYVGANYFVYRDVQFEGDVLYDGISGPRSVLDRVIVTTTGTIAGPASAETNIANLQLTADLVSGRTYMIYAQIRADITVASDDWSFRLRRDTAVTGAELGNCAASGWNLIGTQVVMWLYRATSTEASVDFFLSFARIAGTGTMSVLGAVGSTPRSWAAVADIGANTETRTS